MLSIWSSPKFCCLVKGCVNVTCIFWSTLLPVTYLPVYSLKGTPISLTADGSLKMTTTDLSCHVIHKQYNSEIYPKKSTINP